MIIQQIKEKQAQKNVQPSKKLVLYIKREVSLIRNPETNSQVIATILPFDSVIFTGNVKTRWLNVIHGSNVGWIIDNAANFTMKRNEIICRIISSKQMVNLRDYPSVNGKIICTITSVEILTPLKISEDQKWIKVTDRNGVQGWLWKKFVVLF
jgi:SH3-like domain-containing protein